MMSERFELDVRLDMPKLLIDTATNKRYHLLLINDIEEVVDLLNEFVIKCHSLEKENEQLKCINDQLEERLENSGIGVALKMDCNMNE